MSLSPSSNWINSRKHDPRPNALHATQTQNGRESSSQRSSPYLSFNNSSNLNEHTSTNTPRSNRIKQNILQKMVDGYRWFFAVRTGREEADVRRNFSKETTFLSWRSVFIAVHHPWPWIILCSVLTVRRKKETTDLRTIRIAISTRPSPLPPLPLLAQYYKSARLYDEPAVIKSGNSSRENMSATGCFDFARQNYRRRRVSFRKKEKMENVHKSSWI